MYTRLCPEEIAARAIQLARAPSSARANSLTYLEWHMLSKICLSAIQIVLLLKHVKCLIKIKQDKAEIRKQKVTVTSVAVATKNCLFGTSDCTVNNVGTGDLSLVRGILHVCGHAYTRPHVSPDMD